MPTILKCGVDEVRFEIAKVKAAGARVVDRLADRAAYATAEEFQELRSLMTALRLLGEKVDGLMQAAADAPAAEPMPKTRKAASPTMFARSRRVASAVEAADAMHA